MPRLAWPTNPFHWPTFSRNGRLAMPVIDGASLAQATIFPPRDQQGHQAQQGHDHRQDDQPDHPLVFVQVRSLCQAIEPAARMPVWVTIALIAAAPMAPVVRSGKTLAYGMDAFFRHASWRKKTPFDVIALADRATSVPLKPGLWCKGCDLDCPPVDLPWDVPGERGRSGPGLAPEWCNLAHHERACPAIFRAMGTNRAVSGLYGHGLAVA